MTRKELVSLTLVIVAAFVGTHFLQAQRDVGDLISDQALVDEVGAPAGAPTASNRQADVTLVVFSDYRCPACRRAYPALKRAVEQDGRVRLVYRDWPIFGPPSEEAARVALASSFQGLYAQVHDRLMRGPVASEDDRRAAVEGAGGSWRRLRQDLQQHHLAIEQLLARSREYAIKLRLEGTPGYLAGAYLARGALSEGEFRRLIAQARARSFRQGS